MKKDILIIAWAIVVLFFLAIPIAQQQVVTEKIKTTSLIDKVQNDEPITYQEFVDLIETYNAQAKKGNIVILDVNLADRESVVKKIGEVVKTKL